MRSLGAMNIKVLRGVEDQKAFDHGLNNTTTARDLSIILAAIQENKAASPKSCAGSSTLVTREAAPSYEALATSMSHASTPKLRTGTAVSEGK